MYESAIAESEPTGRSNGEDLLRKTTPGKSALNFLGGGGENKRSTVSRLIRGKKYQETRRGGVVSANKQTEAKKLFPAKSSTERKKGGT